ncbi:Thioesterase/thiol ester dehydrase-isomerase [Rhizopus microsporus var. microsporus]|uniref:Thioesterase/thiol ester dehydrase-isomerase n=1 Tax=Rhizopus microsporus var. microsporus TaxID=86635 RepID=A0A1X0R1L5_RHIZD|nr:Thioesterase/thiol ester dehydrase-isomerase [Rhizopus microsporus var. microsporus]
MPSFVRSAFEQIRDLWIRTIVFITSPIFQRLLPDPYTKAGNVRDNTKPAHVSRVTMTEIISSQQCDLKGFAYAGTILGWIDIAAGIAAKRHAISPSVTRSVDDVAFLHPVKLGDIVSIQASVNKSWKTSMEVGVKVEAESPLTNERFFVAHAYLTFVALSPRPRAKTHLGRVLSGYQPIPVPELVPHSPMEMKRYEMADQRRQARFKQQKPNYQAIRDLMREWSQGLKTKADGIAPIKRYPGYSMVEHSSYNMDMDTEEQHEEPVKNDKKGRRFSQDPRMIQQVKEKPMDFTFAEVVELVMPQHANTLSITFGGQIMAWMEICARASANRLAKAYLLTASIDSLNFIASSGVGDVVTIRSVVSRSFNSSMEVYVSVETENLLTGETKFTNDGFFTITAVDHENIPVIIPKVVPQTQAEIDLHEGGHDRRIKRLQRRRELIHFVNSSSSSSSTAASVDA